jgi:uncharacterized protein (TIGR03032 family)
MTRLSALVLACCLWIALGSPQAYAEQRRIALVVGNSAYTATTPLPNPANDAAAFAAFLTAHGFEVEQLINADRAAFDVASGETVAGGRSMPHSPRWHDGRLWLLNSGTGEFGHIDLAAGRFEPVAFCPGYARGLAFIDGFAVIGLSRPRAKTPTFEGLALSERLAEKGAEPRCGLHVVDLGSGDASHWLRIEGVVEELYDVAVLAGVQRPMALGFKTDEIKRMIRIGPRP